MALVDISSQLSPMDRSTHNRFGLQAGYDIRTEDVDDTYPFPFAAAFGQGSLEFLKSGASIGLHTRNINSKFADAIRFINEKTGLDIPTRSQTESARFSLGLTPYNNLGFQLGYALTGDINNPLNSLAGMGLNLLGTNVEKFLDIKDKTHSNFTNTINPLISSLTLANMIGSSAMSFAAIRNRHRANVNSRTVRTNTLDGAGYIASLRTHSRNRLSSEDMANYAELARSLQQNISFNQNPAKNYLNQITIRNN